MLPELAAAMATKLLNETTYAQERLQNSPDNVADPVEYIHDTIPDIAPQVLEV